MRRNVMIDKIVLVITSILLIVGVAYICMNDNDNRNKITTNIVKSKENHNNKIIKTNEIKELTMQMNKLKQEFEAEKGISIHVTDSITDIVVDIMKTNGDNNWDDIIKRMTESHAMRSLEEYTGKKIGEDITIFFDKENRRNKISKVYNDCNTTITMRKNQDLYDQSITISIYDYDIEDSYYQDIDKMIRGDGYSLLEISQDDGTNEMIYHDIGFVRGTEEVDNVEINSAVVDLRIVTKNNEISQVSLLGESMGKNKEEIIITEYQSKLISRLVAALGIPQAEEKIKELLFDSDTTHTKPKITEGDGYEIKSTYVVRDRNDDRNNYNSRLDIRVK